MIPKGAKYLSITKLYYKLDNGTCKLYHDKLSKWIPAPITEKEITGLIKAGKWKKLENGTPSTRH